MPVHPVPEMTIFVGLPYFRPSRRQKLHVEGGPAVVGRAPPRDLERPGLPGLDLGELLDEHPPGAVDLELVGVARGDLEIELHVLAEGVADRHQDAAVVAGHRERVVGPER